MTWLFLWFFLAFATLVLVICQRAVKCPLGQLAAVARL